VISLHLLQELLAIALENCQMQQKFNQDLSSEKLKTSLYLCCASDPLEMRDGTN
jgi:hypothetical protein